MEEIVEDTDDHLSPHDEVETEHENGEQTTTHYVTTKTEPGGQVVSVPVSLHGGSFSLGSLNVIETLPNQYSFLSAGDEIKTAHIVIQQHSVPETVTTSTSTHHVLKSDQSANQGWTETINMEVLPIRCKTTTAELYKSRLGSGGRGRCIKYKEQWLTPSEFENLCGRGSSKDWKRSIRFGGRSLQALIDEGILLPHATSCTCSACCDDDSTASGPVRLFTPYKRRKRCQIDPTTSKKKNVKSEQDNSDYDLSMVSKEEAWQNLTDGIVGSTEYLDPSSQLTAEANIPIDHLKTLCAQMVKATNEFKRCINEAKDLHVRQIERLTRERDAAILSARVHNDVDDPNGMQMQNEVEIANAKKCANCNRDAMAECSLCRKTPYCSTFCQRKDWQSHQSVCRSIIEGPQQIMFLVDE